MPETNDNIANAKIAKHDAPGEGRAPQVQPANAQFEVGSYVTFGRYPQNSGDTPEPIEWLVLDNDGKTALLLSKYGLDCQPFHGKCVETSWRECDLRRWMNRDFLSRAFSADEQGRIFDSSVYTGDNPHFGTRGCGLTCDKLFCLSLEEAWKYFSGTKKKYGCKERWHSDAADANWWVCRERACKATAYAVSNGAYIGANSESYYGKAREWWFDNCFFWLRSQTLGAEFAAYVNNSGAVAIHGCEVNFKNRAVRPALRIKLQ